MVLDTESNPYSSRSSNDDLQHKLPGASQTGLDFVPIMRRWERLWLYYNGTLILFVLFLSFVAFPDHATDIEYWLVLCVGGVIANLCFLIAPTIEAYGTYFRLWNSAFTILLFLAGLGLTALLALSCIVSYPLI